MLRSGVALLAACALLAGCGSEPKTIDPTRVEKAIEVSVAQQSHRLSIVVCPTAVKREKGKTMICIATLSRGQQIPFKVTQRDDRGNVRYEEGSAPPGGAGATTG